MSHPDDRTPGRPEPPSYPFLVRASHALTFVTMIILMGSGLQIFNAHPTLYAADDSNDDHIVFSMPSPVDPKAQPQPDPKLQKAGAPPPAQALEVIFLGHHVQVPASAWQDFPAPLALGRLARRWPPAALHGGLDHDAHGPGLHRPHARLPPQALRLARPRGLQTPGPRHPRPPALPPHLTSPDGQLNPLQKIAYFSVPLILTPWVVASGLALSPRWDAIFPFWVDLFGGRQFARTWHFAGMLLLMGFIASHVALVALAGPRTFLHMVTGRLGRTPTPAERNAS